MDIIVTTPKSEMENAKREAEFVERECGSFFRALPQHPKRLGTGDRIYFVEDGFIRGHGTVFSILFRAGDLPVGERCQATGRKWKGKCIVHYNRWKWLKNPVPMKGFQGFRYMDSPSVPEVKS
jgi:hypothetical protein